MKYDYHFHISNFRSQEIRENHTSEEDRLCERARDFQERVDRVSKATYDFLETLRQSTNLVPLSADHIVNEAPQVSGRQPEVMRCDDQPNSRTIISDFGIDRRSIHKRRKGLAGKLKHFFRRRDKGYSEISAERDSTAEGTRRNLMGQSMQ